MCQVAAHYVYVMLSVRLTSTCIWQRCDTACWASEANASERYSLSCSKHKLNQKPSRLRSWTRRRRRRSISLWRRSRSRSRRTDDATMFAMQNTFCCCHRFGPVVGLHLTWPNVNPQCLALITFTGNYALADHGAYMQFTSNHTYSHIHIPESTATRHFPCTWTMDVALGVPITMSSRFWRQCCSAASYARRRSPSCWSE